MIKKMMIVFLAFCLLAWGIACKRSAKQEAQVAPQAPEAQKEWYRYISAYSSGFISRKAPIQVLFVGNVGSVGQEPALLEGVLEFKPSLRGKTGWKSVRELNFIPSQALQPGVTYKAVLRLDKIMKLPKGFERFEFSFTAIPPGMEIQAEGLSPEGEAVSPRLLLRGSLTTSESEDNSPVEKILDAEHDGRKLSIEWVHEPDGKRHLFTVRSVERKDEDSVLKLRWDGRPIGVDGRGEREWVVPPVGRFKLLSAEAVEGDPSHIALRFSDYLKKNQNLSGLVRVEGHSLTFEVEENSIRLYSSKGFVGSVTVEIDSGVRNFADRKLGESVSQEVTFRTVAPQVRFAGKGVILPEKERLTIPIEAVNLKSVQVTAFQIFSHNMSQFFQLNSLEGSDELTRAGRFLWRKTISLSDDPAAAKQWVRYSLDVTPLLRENPGSLFRITLSFNRGNSTYPCPESEAPPIPEPAYENQEDVRFRDISSWDYAEDYYDEGRFDWEDRNDPCSDTYYNPQFNAAAAVSRNFIASNVGLIAKLEENLNLHVVTTDIRTGQPLSGARVRVFNYQNQQLAEGASDGSGFLTLKLAARPFYLSAQSGEDIGYLRLNKDSALAVSHFDVGGEAIQKGIKGAIYGERGVWRPGDSIYLTFVLYDRDRVLPKDHPVVLELFNPKGQLIQTYRPANSLESFHCFRVGTDEDAPTGAWKARVLVGGLTFDKTLRIETVVPNRLKIQFNPGRDVLVKKEMPVEGKLSSQWLHGAVAADLHFDVKVRYSRRPTRFSRYQDYIFDDPARDFFGAEQNISEGDLDDKGEARFPIKLDVDQPSPGMLDATFVTRVFEETGDFSSDTLTLPFHPFSSYVGIKTPKGDEARGMLLTDQDHTVNIVTLDPSGSLVSRKDLEVSLYKISWKWWWDKSGESLAQYASASITEALQRGVVSTVNGEGQWKFKVKYPDWGRYLVRVVDPAGGHATGKIVYIDWPGWAGRAREEKGPGASRLNFTADKQSYRVGEKAVIYLPEAPEGRALVSLENGSSVVRQMWMSTKQGENRFELELSEEMSPNIYVHVTLLQPHSGKKSDAPIRLYGVIPILVENPKTQLSPQLKLADELKPKQDFTVAVSEKDGRAMTYTLAVVDEGLLGLTRFATPDLRKEFYSREALGILTWDLFDDVVEAYGAELSRLLAIGGGEEGAEEGRERKQRRFPPVVLFEGPFLLEAKKTASHTLKMPQYFGAVRVMLVAGSEGAYGLAEKSVAVREDLMILPTLPRVVRPDEQVDLPISVFVSNPDIREVRIAVETNEMFKLIGTDSQTVQFSKPGDEIVSFELATAPRVGQGWVRFEATAGSHRVEDKVFIPVVSANPRVVRSVRAEIEPGRSWQQSVVPFGLDGTNEVLIEASAVPPINLEKRLDFLIQFPHGCLEQTLSIAFPQLYLKNLVKLDADTQKAVEKHVNAAIVKMSRFQAPNGGFAYWPGGYEAHSWTSSYAAYFLLEASRLGYHLPETMVNKWKQHQKQLANVWTTGGAEEKMNQAFRLFTLALARDPDLGAMNRLREMESLNSTAALLLASAFHLSGQGDAAEDLMKKCDWTVPDYRDDRNTFGSAFRDKALMVRMLVQMNKIERAEKLIQEIVPHLADDRWLSTQETAFGLIAISDFFGGTQAKPTRFRLGWNGEAPQEMAAETPFFQKRYPGFPAAGRKLTVSNPAESKLYVTLYTIGVPPAGKEVETQNNLKVSAEYQDLDEEPINLDVIPQGWDFVVVVKVANLSQRRINNLALTHMIPAGCQIANPSYSADAPKQGYFDFQDVRDDRIYTYFGLEAGAEKVFRVVLNASYNGRYYLPGIAVESMYDASYHANTKGQWVEIVK
jgi:uncharacterized protein YfaS (alpha-2-macroglobulin family)